MDELLQAPIAPEPRTTCSSCPQLAPDLGELQFDERTKCCTYMPALYNFLTGFILEDDDPAFAAGRATVEARLQRGEAVTPLGLLATPEYVQAYADDGKFGRAYELRCPHYLSEQGGLCGVWKHREGTCATWFCRHVRGAVAFDFWRRGMSPLLRAAERKLADWCARQLGATATDWGRWARRPRALFAESARLVLPLRWRDVEEIGGDEVQQLAAETREHHAALRAPPRQPERPRLAHCDLHHGDAATARLATYTPFDPLEVPAPLYAELHRFDGRPRAEPLRELKALGLAPSAELLQRLFDWRVLVEDGEEAPVPLEAEEGRGVAGAAPPR